MTIIEILDKYRKTSSNNRDLGTNFEKLVKYYLLNDAKYRGRFTNVWLWGEFPNKQGSDNGIDLVAEELDGTYCGIQCKFYGFDTKIDKSDLDSFFTASGKENFSSRIIVSTTPNWTKKAEESLKEQQIPVTRIDLVDLENSSIDWNFYLKGEVKSKIEIKKLRDHQIKALEAVRAGFKTQDRGKIIMACGTGKTFTSLKIMEDLTQNSGSVLFLVPSLALLSQTHKEWSEQTSKNLKQFAVCSDSAVGKNEEDLSLEDLEIPATTNHKTIIKNTQNSNNVITVIYSTYHSLDVLNKAQEEGLKEFDLIICDEAHRTTGADGNFFTKIHDNNYIKAKKRLYMTATPRIFSESSKSKAKESEVEIFSMDDESKYGKELYHIGFGEAVQKELLSDYKVLILAVSESYVSTNMQKILSSDGFELKLDDVSKIIGCWNGLSKNIEGVKKQNPMQRAVAFSSTIASSKAISNNFSNVVEEYKTKYLNASTLNCNFKHVDGKMNAFERKEKLEWLKAEDLKENECRILSNAKCLSEGVDVPSLDAVMFLQPRKSQIDIIQAVGRVMRKTKGKDVGYIILPIAVTAGKTPEEALNNNKPYEAIWQILNALRSHDERLDAIINSLALNDNKDSEKINIIGVGLGKNNSNNEENIKEDKITSQLSLNLDLGELKEAIYAKIVTKCGKKTYWNNFAKDVADIAQSTILRIKDIVEQNKEAEKHFNSFLESLQSNINTAIGKDEAIEMLGQHIITKPIFNALFSDYNFSENNVISKEMQSIINILVESNIEVENENLEDFYENIKIKVAKIDNAEGKQKVIIELYDKFFKAAFPKLVERLGIVYTPVDVVDFIINSVEAVLKDEFNTSLSNKNVNIIDPFTGTGTFITRLLQSGLIKKEDLEYKYKNEIHANEIVLLAYYIASINIETVYHYIAKESGYTPFEGIVLTDTFNLYEEKSNEQYQGRMEDVLPENSSRIKKQKNAPVKVIIGNPPYSVGQKSENDNNKSVKYPLLDSKIANTYIKNSTANKSNSSYDSYIRAIRWATDRIPITGGGNSLCY